MEEVEIRIWSCNACTPTGGDCLVMAATEDGPEKCPFGGLDAEWTEKVNQKQENSNAN